MRTCCQVTTAYHWDSGQICQIIAKGRELVPGQKSGEEREELCLTQRARHSEAFTATGLTALPGGASLLGAATLQVGTEDFNTSQVTWRTQRAELLYSPLSSWEEENLSWGCSCTMLLISPEGTWEAWEMWEKNSDFLTPTMWISFKNILLLQNWVTDS